MTTLPLNQPQAVPTRQFVQAAALATLYTTYSPSLLRLLINLVGDPERAEDLLHDTFIKISTHLHRYDADQGGLYNWFATMARNVAMDELRSRTIRREAATYIRERESDCLYPLAPERLQTEQVYPLLPAKYGQVLELIYTRGLTHPEIAQELGLPLGTVKTRCRVGLQKLQQFFRQDIHHYRRS
ncbi:RNA polymerase sigma factor [Spirosoma validum]|uniref:Sigma-70 family RNA polymerase sigma factor n=1 Tax=Spirosoma validum TaxID=2771355 RepID=A0A927GHG4_9BACT|nr:sigma-70 family RNA polymerase sigma factor [Spirosoma validum]MBD2757688.1 sigma-70 family RNA polymerase sigma factor [Spirosoma validum]